MVTLIVVVADDVLQSYWTCRSEGALKTGQGCRNSIFEAERMYVSRF